MRPHTWLPLSLFALSSIWVAACGGTGESDDDITQAGDDDTNVTGDDDTTSGDDDSSAATASPEPTPTAAPTPTATPVPTPTPRPGDSDGDGVDDALDCAPLDAQTFPGAAEWCDGMDNDCDGEIDESMFAGDTGKGNCGIHVMTPSTGAMAVPTALKVVVDFESTEYAKTSWIDAHVTGSDGSVVQLTGGTVDPEVPSRVRFDVFGTKPGVTYTVILIDAKDGTFTEPYSGWVIKARATFSQTVPCGVTFNTSAGMKISKLGASSGLVLQGINANIQTSQAQLGFVYLDMAISQTFPTSGFQVALGAMTAAGKSIYTPEANSGFPTLLTGTTIDAGGKLVTVKQDMPLLVPVGSTVAIMYTHDALMTASVSQSGDFRFMNDFKTTGWVSQADMHKMLVDAGQTSVESQVKMDIDTNSDGVPDAASLEITSSPSIGSMLQCQ